MGDETFGSKSEKALGEPEDMVLLRVAQEYSVGWFFLRIYTVIFDEFLLMSYSFCPEFSRAGNQLQIFGNVGQPKIVFLVSEYRSNVKEETPLTSS